MHFSKIFTLALMACLAASAWATPLGPDGSFVYDGGSMSSLQIEVNAPVDVLNQYTIGLYDLNRMTAGVGDPDFQVQALQADRAIVLQEAGQGRAGSYNITLQNEARLGVFLMKGATLREFSLGRNASAPIFSTLGAPGSELLRQVFGENSLQLSLQSLGVLNNSDALNDPLSIRLFSSPIPNLANDFRVMRVPQPVVPEPGTLALVGLGLSAAGMAHRRRRRKA